MNPNFEGLEADLTSLMDGMLKVVTVAYPNVPENIFRQKIVATNLKALVQVILIGDDEDSGVKVNLKALCLGLLAAADWLDPEGVPDAVPGYDGGLEI